MCVTWHFSFICVTWLCNMTHLCVTRLIRMCEMTHSYVWHDSFICGTWLCHVCDMTHTFVGMSPFVCVKWLIHMCDMTYTCVGHELFVCVTWLIHICDMFISRACLLHICVMTHSYVGHSKTQNNFCTSHIRFSHITHILSHVTHVNASCHAGATALGVFPRRRTTSAEYLLHLPHTIESHYVHEWVMSHM